MAKKVKYLVIHCTATPEGRDVTADDIARMHKGALKNADGTYTFLGVKYSASKLMSQILTLPSGKNIAADKTNGRGWRQFGYSDMVMLDGSIVELVPNNNDQIVDVWEITNGVAGINDVSRHIVYVGGTDKNGKAKDTRTDAQKKTLTHFVHYVVSKCPDIKIAGHYQFENKACPSFKVPEFCREIGIAEKNIYTP